MIDLLMEIEFTNHNEKMRTRTLLLRSYYELITPKKYNYYEIFLSLCSSFEKYLRRSNLKDKQQQLDFVKKIRILAKKKLGDDTEGA